MRIITITIIFFFFFSCESNEDYYARCIQEYESNIPHFRSYRKEMLAFSKKQVGEKEYNKVHEQLMDTLLGWHRLGSAGWRSDTTLISRNLDKLICFSRNQDKIVGAILLAGKIDKKINVKNGTQNLSGSIIYMLGAKIDGNWYFWSGANQVVSKEMNSDLKKGKPISFFQLENYCVEQVLGGYMTKDRKMNHKWFKSLFFDNNFKDRLVIDGFKIDNEQKYNEYIWMRNAMYPRIIKAQNDSIASYVKQYPKTKEWREMHLNDTIENDIRASIREYILQKYMFAVTKYPNQTVWVKK